MVWPLLLEVARVQAHALIPVLGLEHAEPWCAAWVAHAEAISVRRLEEDVERALVTGSLDPRSLSMQTGAHPTVSGETIQLFFTAPADVARLFKAVLLPGLHTASRMRTVARCPRTRST